MKNRLRNGGYTAMVLLAVFGLIYTLKLDTSTPKVTQTIDETPTLVEVDMPTDTPDFTDISYMVGNVGLQFTLDEQQTWIWLDDPEFPLDTTYIEQLSQGLAQLSAQQTIVLEENQTLADYELDTPWATVTAVHPDESEDIYAFGKATSDEKAHYAIKNGDESTVYIYGTDWLEMVNIPIFDMCVLPELPTLTDETVVSVVIGTGETTVNLPLEAQGEAPEVVELLGQFQLEKCFTFKPSEKAVTICGFDDPSATLSVTYTSENDEQERVLLYFGTVAMDETYRYVRYNDDTTIYLMDATLAEQLIATGA